MDRFQPITYWCRSRPIKVCWCLVQAEERRKAAAALAAERAKLEEAALPLMLDAMWAANVLDIQHTVKAVCHEVHPDLKTSAYRYSCHTPGSFQAQRIWIDAVLSSKLQYVLHAILACNRRLPTIYIWVH